MSLNTPLALKNKNYWVLFITYDFENGPVDPLKDGNILGDDFGIGKHALL